MIRSRWLFAILLSVLFVARSEALDVKVETSAGEIYSGQWNGSTASSIRIQSNSETQEIPFDQIVSMRPLQENASASGPSMNVALIDGSSIFVQDFSMDDASLTIEPRRQAAIKLPIKLVRSIRFRLGAASTDPQWLGMTEKESRSDLMVIRRGNDQLDPIEGVVIGLDLKKLEFELDGDPIEAPLERLEGVLFRTSQSASSTAVVKINDIYGSTYLTSRLEKSDAADSVEFLIAGQVKHRIEMKHLRSITWASGRVMLAGEAAAAVDMKPTLITKVPQNLIQDWFAPVSEGDDLIAAAGGSIEYRVSKGFQTLAGSAARDDKVVKGGAVSVRILVDDDVQWEQTLTDTDSKGFRIPIAGALRVRLEVVAGDDGDVGDQVRFSKPRLLK